MDIFIVTSAGRFPSYVQKPSAVIFKTSSSDVIVLKAFKINFDVVQLSSSDLRSMKNVFVSFPFVCNHWWIKLLGGMIWFRERGWDPDFIFNASSATIVVSGRCRIDPIKSDSLFSVKRVIFCLKRFGELRKWSLMKREDKRLRMVEILSARTHSKPFLSNEGDNVCACSAPLRERQTERQTETERDLERERES